MYNFFQQKKEKEREKEQRDLHPEGKRDVLRQEKGLKGSDSSVVCIRAGVSFCVRL